MKTTLLIKLHEKAIAMLELHSRAMDLAAMHSTDAHKHPNTQWNLQRAEINRAIAARVGNRYKELMSRIDRNI